MKLEELTQRLVGIASAAFGDDLTAAVVHGSAYTGGDFLPCFSDFDIHFYLRAGLVAADAEVRLDRALRFRSAFTRLDPEDYGVYYTQPLFLPEDSYPLDWPAPIPGTFRIAYGAAPAGWSDGARPSHLEAARSLLEALDSHVDSLLRDASDATGARFARWVRLIGTVVKPTAYSAATLITNDAVGTWTSTLDDVFRVLGRELDVRGLRAFYEEARAWRVVRDDEVRLETMARAGLAGIWEVGRWYADCASNGRGGALNQ